MTTLPRLSRRLALAMTLAAGARAQDNVLLVVLDDVGVDRVRAYDVHPSPAPTPVLDALAAEGVLFENCWSNPYCSPTRATILTGRYGFRTGIGTIIPQTLGHAGLSLAEWTLPEVLAQGTGGAYRTAAIGKWHLASASQGWWHAMDSGFDLYAGSLFNLGPEPWVWYDYTKVIPGSAVHVTRYATTDEVDDALRAIGSFGDEPWLVHLAFHAAHLPYHRPPPELHDRPLSGDPEDSKSLHHKAAVQAIDTELGRLLDSIDPRVRERTTVIVVGDNGTQGPAMEPPYLPGHGKGTLHEGGVRVPLIVAGPGVASAARGQRCAALVNTTDLFATAAELCGVDARAVVPPEITLDSESLGPYLTDPDLPSARSVVFAESFTPNHPTSDYDKLRRAVRGPRYKLVRDVLAGEDQLFDLELDPYEGRDLLTLGEPLTPDQRRAYRDLARWLAEIVE